MIWTAHGQHDGRAAMTSLSGIAENPPRLAAWVGDAAGPVLMADPHRPVEEQNRAVTLAAAAPDMFAVLQAALVTVVVLRDTLALPRDRQPTVAILQDLADLEDRFTAALKKAKGE